MIKNIFRVLVTVIILTTISSKAYSQELMWDADFDFFFDNREYKSKINWPQTLFGARVSPEIGVRLDGKHSLMIGVSLLANFGAKPFEKGNEVFAYYQFDSEKFKAYAGVIPRRKLITEYSGAFFSDSISYYDPNLTGLLLQYKGGRGYVEFAADWNSMITNENREKFILFSAGRINAGMFYGGYNLSMYHHAGTYLEDGVVDNVLAYPFVGIDLKERTCMDALSFQVGWLKTFQNDRKYVGKYVTPGGVQVELRAEKWKFGIYNTFYAGKNLMPYYLAELENLDYGPGLYWGEPFYRTGNIYNRLELFWQPINTKRMNLRVSSVHHYDGKIWNWQQKVCMNFNFGQQPIFKKKKK